jgi:hypothetical protein
LGFGVQIPFRIDQPSIQLVNACNVQAFAPSTPNGGVAVTPTPQQRVDFHFPPLPRAFRETHDDIHRFGIRPSESADKWIRALSHEKALDSVEGYANRM